MWRWEIGGGELRGKQMDMEERLRRGMEEGAGRSKPSWTGRVLSGSNNEEEEKGSIGFVKDRADITSGKIAGLDVRTVEDFFGLV